MTGRRLFECPLCPEQTDPRITEVGYTGLWLRYDTGDVLLMDGTQSTYHIHMGLDLPGPVELAVVIKW